jgi:iron complex outermembrane recepter protein
VSDWISRDYYADDFVGDQVFVNIADVEMRGAEVGLRWTPMEALHLSMEYTITMQGTKVPGGVTDKVAGVPENQFVAGISAQLPKIDVRMDLRGIYVDNIYEDLPTAGRPDTEITRTSDYFILNARLAKDFLDHFSGYIECENLFDKDYESEIGFPGRGRNVLFGMTARY